MKTIEKIVKELNKIYDVKPWREDPFKVLITTILSQRTKDEVTREASKKLLEKADTPKKLLKLRKKEIEKLIYPVGFYRQKAKKIKKLSKILLEKYGGKVPSSRDELMKLPGVGSKTADCVLCFGYGRNEIPVDTHVAVISRRLGLTDSEDPEKIRNDLHKKIPEKLRPIVNSLFVEFGKDICRTVKPKCYACPILEFCPYKSKNL